MEVLQAKNLKKIYGSGNNAVHALDGVDLSVKKGEFVAIVGTSGSGKSTLLHMLGGLDRPTSGTVMVDGQDIFSLKEEALTIFRRRKIGFVFQAYNLVPVLNVYENIVLPIELDGGKVNKDFVQQIVQTLGLDDRLDALPNQLSGGQQQRVALARILCSEPEAILLDEPFSALDSYLKWNLEIELADLLATFNGPILWVSHDRDECYRNCRSVCVMEDGRTGEVTPMDEMIRHPGSVSAARLAGCKNFFAAEARDGKVYLPEWNVALPLAGMENTFTTIGIPDNAVTMSENGAMSCTVCRMILGVEENILLLRPEGSAEGAPMLRITVGHESDLQAGAAVRVALDYSKLLLL